MDLIIRQALSGDAGDIAYLSYLAGKGHVETSVYDLMIPGAPGPTAERLGLIGRMLTTDAKSWLHYSCYTVAALEGGAAASLCAFGKEEGGTRPLIVALQEVGWNEDDLAGMGERMQPFLRVEHRVPEDAWVIENVACLERLRHRGLTNALVEHAIDKGLERGYKLAQIEVFVGNTPAIRAYEKVGFEITGEKRDPEFERIFGSPGMYRMTLRL